MANIILTRPREFHRRPDFAGQQGRFDHEVGLRLAPKAAAQQSDVNRDIFFGNTQGSSQGLAGRLRTLRWPPNLQLIPFEFRHRTRRLHLRMRGVRDEVLRFHDFRRPGQGFVKIAFFAHHVPGFA